MKLLLKSIVAGLAVLAGSGAYASAITLKVEVKTISPKNLEMLARVLHDSFMNFPLLTDEQVDAILDNRAKFEKLYVELFKKPISNVTRADLERSEARRSKKD